MPILLGLLTLAYFPVLRTTFFSDDYVLLWQARAHRFDLSLFQVEPGWFFYRPLGKLVWLIMYRIWGTIPAPYHALSLGLHWLNGLLIIALVRRLLPASRSIAPIAGILFVLLPLQVETVVWSACFYDLLATLFYLLTLLCLLIAREHGSLRWYALSLGTFQLGLWSKELSFTLPLVVVMLSLIVANRPRLRVIMGAALPYIVLVTLNLWQRYLTWGSFGGYSGTDTNVLPRIWDILAATLATMIAPLNRQIVPASIVQVWLLAMTILIVAGLMTGYNRRVIVLALAWIVVTLLPVLNILPIGSDLQNSRLLYLPSAGFCIGLAALLDALVKRRIQRFDILPVVAVVTLVYIVTIQIQIQPWLHAGRETIHTAQELHRLIPYLSSGTTLQAKGLPDSYKGAFIYRLGLSEAYDLMYGSRFNLQQLEQLPPLARQQSDNLFQVVFDFDYATEQWEIIQAQGVTDSDLADPELPASAIQWDFTTCADSNRWQPTPQKLDCQAGNGWQLSASDQHSSLQSPRLDLTTAGWTEVIVRLEHAGNLDENALIRLEWSSESDKTWHRQRSLVLDLLPGTRSYDYHFFVRPDSKGAPLEQLRLSQDNARHVSIKSVSVRSIR